MVAWSGSRDKDEIMSMESLRKIRFYLRENEKKQPKKDTGFDLSSLLPLLSERRTRAAKQGSSTKCCFVSSPTLVLLLQTPVLQASDSVIFSEPAPPSTVQRGRAEA
ncbi:hypothetical protein K1719_044549 [Acacia pycnantha]|nr:hypothetical protein K1719_044549 [Acacia pycnantha]